MVSLFEGSVSQKSRCQPLTTWRFSEHMAMSFWPCYHFVPKKAGIKKGSVSAYSSDLWAAKCPIPIETSSMTYGGFHKWLTLTVMENPNRKLMRTGDTPILGNLHNMNSYFLLPCWNTIENIILMVMTSNPHLAMDTTGCASSWSNNYRRFWLVTRQQPYYRNPPYYNHMK